MRERRARARLGHTALPDDDGMALSGVSDAVEETPPVAHAFDVHPDHAGGGVGRHQIDVVGGLENQHVADGRRLVHLDAVAGRLQTKVNRVRAALRDEADVARLSDFFFGKIAQAGAGTVQAHAIGTDQRDFGIDREVAQLGFEADSKLLRRL